MTPQDIDLIRKHPFQASAAATITISKGDSEMGAQLSSFCDKLKPLAPHITIKKDSDISFEAPVLVTGRHKNIAYCALPEDKILPLFLQALDPTPAEENALADNLAKLMERIDLPAGLELYVAGQCPHCPQTIRQVQHLAHHMPKLRLVIINADQFPEKAVGANIRSVPTLILDQGFRWSGEVPTEELLTVCADRDPSQLSASSLRQLIEDGDAERVARMMLESDKIFPALNELLTHQRWSVRLGAMVAVEYLADASPSLGISLIELLWDRFYEQPAPVQGDVTHLFGLIDSEVTRGYLHTVAKGDFDEEVKEAARDALAELEG